ncbi:MAG: isocitrate lyase/phosphoenolpyruvate mutase family protein, partial [Proteobacteria bacterium]|nr:isocitrate lyase/phosphoenolpyruvate mutase family protein [Pseudomonadota bacterium]
AFRLTGPDDAVARAKAYEAAGVDAVFLAGAQTREQLEAVSAAVNIPIFLGNTSPELNDKSYLASQGVRICLQGHMPYAAAVQAVHNTLKALRDGTPPPQLTGVASGDLMKQYTRDADHQNWIEEFLGDG